MLTTSSDTGLVFGHKYIYDSDNGIKEAYTSRKNLYKEKQASYEYNLQGPLKRLELGAENVLGIDYTYTLQGWLEAIDGANATIDAKATQFPTDAFAMRLDYFKGDFKTTGTSLLTDSIAEERKKTKNELFTYESSKGWFSLGTLAISVLFCLRLHG